ncbi:MAG: hypothetical protein Q9204_003794 [Flavoplaca sp. TL-2023a]
MIFDCYYLTWKDYIAHYETQIIETTNTLLTTHLDETLRIDFKTLTKLRFIEERLLPLQAILASTQSTLDGLVAHWGSLISCTSTSPNPQQQDKNLRILREHQSNVGPYIANLQHLLRRTDSALNFLSETLSFSNQRTAKEQNELLLRLSMSAKEDSATVRILTVVTLVYLFYLRGGTCDLVPIFGRTEQGSLL